MFDGGNRKATGVCEMKRNTLAKQTAQPDTEAALEFARYGRKLTAIRTGSREIT